MGHSLQHPAGRDTNEPISLATNAVVDQRDYNCKLRKKTLNNNFNIVAYLETILLILWNHFQNISLRCRQKNRG